MQDKCLQCGGQCRTDVYSVVVNAGLKITVWWSMQDKSLQCGGQCRINVYSVVVNANVIPRVPTPVLYSTLSIWQIIHCNS